MSLKPSEKNTKIHQIDVGEKAADLAGQVILSLNKAWLSQLQQLIQENMVI
jgi:hypothetical protein